MSHRSPATVRRPDGRSDPSREEKAMACGEEAIGIRIVRQDGRARWGSACPHFPLPPAPRRGRRKTMDRGGGRHMRWGADRMVASRRASARESEGTRSLCVKSPRGGTVVSGRRADAGGTGTRM